MQGYNDSSQECPAGFELFALLSYRYAMREFQRAGVDMSAAKGTLEQEIESLASPISDTITASLDQDIGSGQYRELAAKGIESVVRNSGLNSGTVIGRYRTYASEHNLRYLGYIMDRATRVLARDLASAESLNADLADKIEAQTEKYASIFGDYITVGDIHDLAVLGENDFLEASAQFFSYTALSGALGDARISAGGTEYDHSLSTQFPYDIEAVKHAIFRNAYARLIRDELSVEFDFYNPSKCFDEMENQLQKISQQLLSGTLSKSEKEEREKIISIAENYIASLRNVDTASIEISDNEFIPGLYQMDVPALLEEKKRLILTDEMGSGKTFQMDMSIAQLRKVVGKNLKTLIVCPYDMKEEIEGRFAKYFSEDERQKYIIKRIDSSAELRGVIEAGELTDQYTGKTGSVDILIINDDLVNRCTRPLEELLDSEIDDIDNEKFVAAVNEKKEQYISQINQATDTEQKRTETLLSLRNKLAKDRQSRQRFYEWRKEYGDNTNKVAELVALVEQTEQESSTLGLLKQYGANFLAVDEAHSAKNPRSLRGEGIVDLALNTEYVLLMTGTLIPNRAHDLISALKIVSGEWNEQEQRFYPTAELNQRTSTIFPSPREARFALLPYLIRRTREEVNPRQYEVGDPVTVHVESDDLTKQVYRTILESQRLYYHQKLLLARRASLNPLLVIDDLIELGEIEESDIVIPEEYIPPKYLALKDLIVNALKDSRKPVIFSSFVDGITSHNKDSRFSNISLLRDYLERAILLEEEIPDLHLEVLDGNARDSTDDIIARFSNGSNGLLGSYGKMSLGKDMSAGSVIIHFDLPYISTSQPDGRVDRLTQTRDIDIYTLCLTDSYLRYLAANSQTIDETVARLVLDKELVSAVILDGAPIRREEMDAYRRLLNMDTDSPTSAEDIQAALTSKDTHGVDNFLSAVNKRGGEKNKHLWLHGYFAEYIWGKLLDENSHSSKVNRAVAQLIDGMPEDLVILDVGGGPGSLIVPTNTEIEIYDMLDWEYALVEYGVRLLENFDSVEKSTEVELIQRILDKAQFRQGYMDSLPYKDRSFDVVSMVYSLHWTLTDRVNSDYSEREAALREAIRTVVNDGYVLIALPPGKVDIENGDASRFALTLNHLGCDPIYTGLVRERGTSFRTVIGLGHKTRDPRPDPLDPHILDFISATGRFRRGTPRYRRNSRPPRTQISTDEFITADGRNIESLIK